MELVITAWILYQTTVATPPPQTAAQRKPAAERRRTAHQQARERRRPEPHRQPHPHRSHHRTLQKIAACESSGNPQAVSPNGRYHGLYQFDLTTWRTVGGAGNPAHAPPAEQHHRAHMLLHRRGTQPWPNCP